MTQYLINFRSGTLVVDQEHGERLLRKTDDALDRRGICSIERMEEPTTTTRCGPTRSFGCSLTSSDSFRRSKRTESFRCVHV